MPSPAAAGANPLAGEATDTVHIVYRGQCLVVHPGLIDQGRYLWELRVLGDTCMPDIRRLQAAQELLVLLFGVPQLDRLIQLTGAPLTLPGATELLEQVTQAVHGAGLGESPAS